MSNPTHLLSFLVGAVGGAVLALRRRTPVGSKSRGGLNEAEVARTLAPELDRHLELTLNVHNAVMQALSSLPDRPLSVLTQCEKVQVNLMIRLANDLRCASLLAARGYPLQVASVVADLFEVAYSVGYIGANDERAQEWIDHEDPTTAFMSVRSLVDEVIGNAPIPDPREAAGRQYVIYRQLCMAKHANPLIQMQHGFEVEEDRVVAVAGPQGSEEAIRVLWFALETAVGLCHMALGAFAEWFLEPADREVVADLSISIETERAALHRLAIKRWGTEDPYPGRWRS